MTNAVGKLIKEKPVYTRGAWNKSNTEEQWIRII